MHSWYGMVQAYLHQKSLVTCVVQARIAGACAQPAWYGSGVPKIKRRWSQNKARMVQACAVVPVHSWYGMVQAYLHQKSLVTRVFRHAWRAPMHGGRGRKRRPYFAPIFPESHIVQSCVTSPVETAFK